MKRRFSGDQNESNASMNVDTDRDDSSASTTLTSSPSVSSVVRSSSNGNTNGGHVGGSRRSKARGSRGSGRGGKNNASNGIGGGKSNADDDDGLLKRAFHIPDDIEVSDGPPATAEEYLLRVRREAQGLASTVVSSINPRAFDEKQTRYVPAVRRLPLCASSLLPRSEWENNATADFAEFRQALIRYSIMNPASSHPLPPSMKLPRRTDRVAWRTFLLGDEAPSIVTTSPTTGAVSSSSTTTPTTTATETKASSSTSDNNTDVETETPSTTITNASEPTPTPSISSTPSTTTSSNVASAVLPSLHIITHLDQVMTRSLLGILTEYVATIAAVADGKINGNTNETATPSEATAAAATSSIAIVLSRQCMLWIWAILARLEKPLHADIGSILCSLYRHLAIIRAAHKEGDADCDTVIHANLILSVIDKCFGQRVI